MNILDYKKEKEKEKDKYEIESIYHVFESMKKLIPHAFSEAGDRHLAICLK